ncbi:response regulator [Pseudomonas sp. CDFA 602]|uniref:PAS domain-containing sensor histidine kinase n=1 Tax=Pseudomonas californiensis TaxID=2829823 RepID=UPI001E537235|nr:PAS domain-containing sensor histidine kinase [Pseudomonas californiensis]MCD5996163.1 response regulator [Pseudomonas californiensis]MCD6001789.1 response regulator [Pseudomonas californiensis]
MNTRPPGLTDAQFIDYLSRQLQEADDVIQAIRTGSVDALLIQNEQGESVYTLDNADKPYRLLVEQMQEGAVTITANGIVLYANQRFGEIVGYPLEQIFGEQFQRYIMPADAHTFETYLASDSTEALRIEATLRSANDRVLPGYLSFSKLPADFSGEPIYCGVITDLTQQKSLESRLHQAEKMEALGQLTGGLAHDFNNLLQAIQGSFDLIIRRPTSEKIGRWAESGLRVADRGAKLTSQLLAFSRSQKLELRVCSVNQVITGMSDLLNATLGADVQLDVQLDPDDRKVMTDPVQLELAILNLAINGRDAMSGAGRLTLATSFVERHEYLSSPVGFLEVRVSDNGAGMSEETRQHAFNPFFTTKDVGQGTGLGLSQVESIIQQSNGAVRLLSALGQGTSIFLTFPCVHGSVSREDSVEVTGEGFATGLQVLVIDDDVEVRRTLVDMLEALGHAAVEAQNGPEGIDAIGQQRFDMVLLDYAMPVMNGAEVAREIHRVNGRMPIVFVSGYSNTDQLRAVMNAQTALLQKPFTIADLNAAIEAMRRHSGAAAGI